MDLHTVDNGTTKMKQKSIRDFYKSVTDSDVAHGASESSQGKNINMKRKNSVPNDCTVEKRKIDFNYNLRKKQVDGVFVDVEGDIFTISEGSNEGSDFVPEDYSNDSSDNGVKETTEGKKNRSSEKVQAALELPKMKPGVGNGESKDNITPKLPNGYSEWMKKSVSRWKLQPPYSLHTEETWRKYYQEREALEWRSEHIWQENGRDCPGKCGDWYDPVKMPKWSLDWKQPRMKPCCAESYAEYRDMTDREEYEELVQHIRSRVNTTIAKCSRIPPPVAEAAAGGAYVLQYWINWEDSGRDADPRTCHFENRFYVPVGTGESYDLHYIYHLRPRFYCDGEKFSSLHVGERTIQDCDPEDPTPIKDWDPAKGCRSKKVDARMVKLLIQEGKKKATRTTQGVLREIGRRILGKEGRMSERKVWALMARAGGMCAAREELNHFKGAQKLSKLAEGEETDEQEATTDDEETSNDDEETSTDDEETSDKEECVIC